MPVTTAWMQMLAKQVTMRMDPTMKLRKRKRRRKIRTRIRKLNKQLFECMLFYT